ncbi:hypothetical protein STEG23_035393, partial [Scotinomys teguina]
MTVTPLGQDQDCNLKNRELDVLALLVPGSWRLEQGRRSSTVLHLPWNLYPVPYPPLIYPPTSQIGCRVFFQFSCTYIALLCVQVISILVVKIEVRLLVPPIELDLTLSFTAVAISISSTLLSTPKILFSMSFTLM